jgi:hypothetical protein
MLALQKIRNGEVAYLLEKGVVVEIDEEEENFLFLFLCTTFYTASLGGNTIPMATTMLVSMLALAAFFCLFFGRPLQVKT